MPKIIENVREQLLAEAKKQISERGYKNTTIRSVASECNIATGTVYNYFKSKDMLIASFILQDWLDCLSSIAEYPKGDSYSFLKFIYTSLIEFVNKHQSLFYDKEASKSFDTSVSERHGQLRQQLAQQIMPIASEEFLAEYVAEAMLCWTMAGKDFEDIYSLLPEKIKLKK